MDVYLMTLLSSLYVIIMCLAINSPGHGNNVVDGIYYIDKIYYRG